MTSQILEKIEQIKAELERNDVPAPFRELTLSPQDYMRLRREVGDMPSGAVNHNPLTGQVDSVLGMPVKVQKPGLEPNEPDQEEMDKLASALTEAVLQLRAGDMDGARKTLMDADYQCGMRIHTQILPTDHYMDALRYGAGVAELKTPIIPDRAMMATEMNHRQQVAERQLRAVQKIMLDNLNNTIIPTIKDPGA